MDLKTLYFIIVGLFICDGMVPRIIEKNQPPKRLYVGTVQFKSDTFTGMRHSYVVHVKYGRRTRPYHVTKETYDALSKHDRAYEVNPKLWVYNFPAALLVFALMLAELGLRTWLLFLFLSFVCLNIKRFYFFLVRKLAR